MFYLIKEPDIGTYEILAANKSKQALQSIADRGDEGWMVCGERALSTKRWTLSQVTALYNSIPNAKPVARFATKQAAIARLASLGEWTLVEDFSIPAHLRGTRGRPPEEAGFLHLLIGTEHRGHKNSFRTKVLEALLEKKTVPGRGEFVAETAQRLKVSKNKVRAALGMLVRAGKVEVVL